MPWKSTMIPPLITGLLSVCVWLFSSVVTLSSKVEAWELWKYNHSEYTHKVIDSVEKLDRKLDCIVYIPMDANDSLHKCLENAKE